MPSVATKPRIARTPYSRPAVPSSAAPAAQQTSTASSRRSTAKRSFLQSLLGSLFHRNTQPEGDDAEALESGSGQRPEAQNVAKDTRDAENAHAKPTGGIAAGNSLVDAALAELREVLADQEGVLDAKSIIQMYRDKVLGADRLARSLGVDSDSESESSEDAFAAGSASASLPKATHSLSPTGDKVLKRRRTVLPALAGPAILRSGTDVLTDASTSSRVLSGKDFPVIPTSRPRPVLTLKPLSEASAIKARKDSPGVVLVDFDLSDDEEPEKTNIYTAPEPQPSTRTRRPNKFPSAASEKVAEKNSPAGPATDSRLQMSSKSPFYTSHLFGPDSNAAAKDAPALGAPRVALAAPETAKPSGGLAAAAPKPTTEPHDTAEPEPSKSLFGSSAARAPASAASASAAPASGAPAAKPAPAPTSLFEAPSIATPPATAPKTSTGFTFGARSEDKGAAPAAPSGFSFGGQKEGKTTAPGLFDKLGPKQDSQPTTFAFGAAAPAKPESKPDSQEPKADSQPNGFAFGATAKPAGFSFGQSQTAPAASSEPAKPGAPPAAPSTFSGFSFGKPDAKEAKDSPKPAAGFSFGSSADQPAGKRGRDDGEQPAKKPLFGAPTPAPAAATPSAATPSAPGSLFGGSGTAAKPFGAAAETTLAGAPKSTGFSFPLAPAAEAPKTAGLFGSAKPATPNSGAAPSLFGASLEPGTNDAARKTAPAALFGAGSGAAAAKPGAMSFSFGASSDKAGQPAPQQPAGASGFSFASSAKMPSSEPAATAPGAFSFAPTQNAPASFGAQPAAGFGAGAASAPGSTSGFTFGASASAPGSQTGSQPAAAAAAAPGGLGVPSFNFGASAPAAPQQPAMFGANANANANANSAQPNLFASGLENSNSNAARRPMARPVRRLGRR